MVSTNREESTPLYNLFAFNMPPDQQHAEHYSLIKKENMRAEIHFSEALTTSVNITMDSIFGNEIEISQRRYVSFD